MAPMTSREKTWIDDASYEDLLRHWRNAKPGDHMFIGDTGDYYAEVMAKRRAEVGPEEHTRASKAIGWDGR